MVDADASQEGSGSWELTGGMVMVEWLVVADLSAQGHRLKSPEHDTTRAIR